MAIEPEHLDRSGRELAATLKRLRKQAGLSGVRLAVRCNMSQSKISRIEGNKSRPSLVDVEQLLRGLDAPPDVATRVMELARVTQTEWQDGRSLRRKGIDKKQLQLAAPRITPSNVVDEGWHALILHTNLYEGLCGRLGRFVHHWPERPYAERHDPHALTHTVAVIEEAGHTVDTALWTGPSGTLVPVAANCSHTPKPGGCGPINPGGCASHCSGGGGGDGE